MKMVFQVAAGMILAMAVLSYPLWSYALYHSYVFTQLFGSFVEQSNHQAEERRLAELRRQDAIRQAREEEKRRKQVEMANWQKHSIDWMNFLEQYHAPEGCDFYDSDSEMAYCVDHRSAAFAKWQGKEQRRTLSAYR